ncbi:serine/threonine-protein kinase [Frankia sp. QA3]|uniref:serine/threonine-protein kinase n=1 Tax=Frankia sp. QA3 TaxID=710111 RepID=UPI000269BB18|nr:serine/threonine-protein kinase [Frankia sp. QA3]EIV91186.1 serine/threonine protein kinase [Frankia sp. QA3]
MAEDGATLPDGGHREDRSDSPADRPSRGPAEPGRWLEPTEPTRARFTGSPRPGDGGDDSREGVAGAGAVPVPRTISSPRRGPAPGVPRDPLRLPRRIGPPPGATPPLLEAPSVPVGLRECAGCGAPVARPGQSGTVALDGTCGMCGHRYSFTVKLRPGERVGRYTVHGVIAHGGLGWVYAATDDNLGGDDVQAWVVLKGLLDAANPEARRIAEGERRILTTVSHPAIVKILDYVAHAGEDYIVMEYVPGISLTGLTDTGPPGPDGRPDPPAPADVLRYLLRVLPALGHLHRMGLVYCDFKPDNVMVTASGVKLIDLGGARRLDDLVSGYLSTPGYRAPELDDDGERPGGIERAAPSVTTDIFAVARTLARLVLGRFPGFVDAYRHVLPPRRAHLPLREFESLDRLLRRATATDPQRRFQSVTELADELVGVLYEIVARTEGPVPPLASRWFDAAGHPTGEAGPAGPPAAWEVLPDLRVDQDDPCAPALTAGPDEDPTALAARLAAIVPVTTEVHLSLARARIRAGQLGEAARTLDTAAAAAPREWRIDWYRGLAALVARRPGLAAAAFDRVYSQVPGELAPRLALATALADVATTAGSAREREAARERAAELFDVVGAIDPGVTSAAFGLARCRTDPTDKIAAYQRVPRSSSAYTASRVRMIGVLVARVLRTDSPAAGSAALLRAAALLADPLLDLGERRRAELRRDIFTAALELVAAGHPPPDGPRPPTLLGRAMTERELRFGLAETYREMARLAPDRAGRVRLIDRANRARPRTLI